MKGFLRQRRAFRCSGVSAPGLPPAARWQRSRLFTGKKRCKAATLLALIGLASGARVRVVAAQAVPSGRPRLGRPADRAATSPARPLKTRPTKTAEAEDARYLDGAVASVNGSPITRREFIIALVGLDPRLLGGFALAHTPQPPDTITVSLAALCRHALSANREELERFVQDLMLTRAMEEVARAHHVPVTASELQQAVRADLELRRAKNEIPAEADADLADRLGDTLANVRRTARRRLLQEHLLRADLNARLGHPLGAEDFFSAHYLFLLARRDGKAPTPADMDAAQARAEQLRARILRHEITFEDAAAQNSDDVTKARQGDLGALPRTLLKSDMEAALLAMEPGGITLPVLINEGCAIARLDKRGAQIAQEERDRALKLYTNYKKRNDEALGRLLKDVRWTNALGQPPRLNVPPAQRP